jgi:hypothetical protein
MYTVCNIFMILKYYCDSGLFYICLRGVCLCRTSKIFDKCISCSEAAPPLLPPGCNGKTTTGTYKLLPGIREPPLSYLSTLVNGKAITAAIVSFILLLLSSSSLLYKYHCHWCIFLVYPSLCAFDGGALRGSTKFPAASRVEYLVEGAFHTYGYCLLV